MLFKMPVFAGKLLALVALSIMMLALLLMAAQSYFNSTELNTLVEQAEEHGLEYEVVIYNQFTNAYRFHAGVKSEDEKES